MPLSDALLAGLPGWTPEQEKEVKEQGLLPAGEFVVEIVMVDGDGAEATYMARDGQTELGEQSYDDTQHILARIQFKVVEGLNTQQVGRAYTEFLRFFNYGIPGLIEALPANLKAMHNGAMGKIYNIVNAAQKAVPIDDRGNKLWLQALQGAQGALLTLTVKLGSDKKTKEPKNFVNFKKYQPRG